MPKCLNDPNKSYKGTEPSPKGLGYCAGKMMIGKKKIGNDGNMWIVKKIKNGSKRWIKLNKNVKVGGKIVKNGVDQVIKNTNKEFLKNSKNINEYLHTLNKIAKYDEKYSKKYNNEIKIAEKYNEHYSPPNGRTNPNNGNKSNEIPGKNKNNNETNNIPKYIPPHKRGNKLKNNGKYKPVNILKEKKKSNRNLAKRIRRKINSNNGIKNYRGNEGNDINKNIQKFLNNSQALRGIKGFNNSNKYIEINKTLSELLKDEKKNIYLIDDDKSYENIFSENRIEKILNLRQKNLEIKLREINIGEIVEKLINNQQFVLLFTENGMPINELIDLRHENVFEIYKLINSLPFINNEIEKVILEFKNYLNYLFVFNNNTVDNLGIVNSLYPKSNFIHTRGCGCNLKIPEKDFISPLFGNLREKQFIINTDIFNCCLKYFDVLGKYKDDLIFDKLSIISYIEDKIKKTSGVFFARINEKDLYFDLRRKRLLQEYSIKKPDDIKDIKKFKFKVKLDPENKRNYDYLRTNIYATRNDKGKFAMYDKYWRKLHDGCVFTTEEEYSDYSLLIKRIYNLFIYRVFLNGERKNYFLLSKYSLPQIRQYYQSLLNSKININNENYQIFELSGGNSDKSLDINLKYRLCDSKLEFDLRILKFFNPYHEYKFNEDLSYIISHDVKREEEENELKDIQENMKEYYSKQFEKLMENNSKKINNSNERIIKDTGKTIDKIIYDLKNFDYKLKTKLEKANADKMGIIKYGPGGSGKGSKLKPILEKLGFYKNNYLDLNIDDIIEQQSYFIEESQKIYNKYMKNQFNKINKNNFNELKYNKININTNKINYYNQQIYLCIRNYFYEKDKTISFNLNNLLQISIKNNKNFVFETTGSYFGLPYWLFKDDIYDNIKNYNLIVLFPIINTAFETFKRTLFRAKKSGNKQLGQRFEPYYQDKKKLYNQSYFYFFNNLLINDSYIKYIDILCMVNNSFKTNNKQTNNLYLQKEILDNNKNINIIKKIDKIEKVYELSISQIPDILSKKNTILVISKKDKDIIRIIFNFFFDKKFNQFKISIDTLALNQLNFNKIYYI